MKCGAHRIGSEPHRSCSADMMGGGVPSMQQHACPSRSTEFIDSALHYGRGKIPRVSLAFPSAKNRSLAKENLLRVLHSGKNCTRGREAFPSASENLALGKEQHSAKALFPECNTRGRSTLGKETCYLTVQPANAVKT